jgi:hypothetical protein
MFKKSKTVRLRGIWRDGHTVAYLVSRLGPELARWTFEIVDVRRYVRVLPPRQRALGLGALAAVGLTTAGVVARRAAHSPDAPT